MNSAEPSEPSAVQWAMDSRARPDAIDTRFVFRLYAWIAIAASCLMYRWGPPDVDAWAPGHLLPLVASTVAAFGCCVAGFAAVDDSIGPQPGRLRSAVAHALFGMMFVIQWFATLVLFVPPVVAWAELTVGLVLLWLAAAAPRSVVSGFSRTRPVRLEADITALARADDQGVRAGLA